MQMLLIAFMGAAITGWILWDTRDPEASRFFRLAHRVGLSETIRGVRRWSLFLLTLFGVYLISRLF